MRNKESYDNMKILLIAIKLLAPELICLILAQAVHHMWITQEPNKLNLGKKLHFEEKNTERI